MTSKLDNIQALRSALLWQAVGDSLGYKYEFQKKPKEEDYLADYIGTGKLRISDDTQMTYFGLRAMEKYLKLKTTDIQEACNLVLHEYKNWFSTQTLYNKFEPVYKGADKDIPNVMYISRVPGNATMESLREIVATGFRAQNKARGCGSVMRLLPFMVGLIPHDQETVLAFTSGYMTHDSQESGDAINKLLTHGRLLLKHGREAIPLILAAEQKIKKAKSIESLGSGFYATECVDMALYALLKNPDNPFDVLKTATIHAGDSDSVAAVAGCLYGLMSKELPAEDLLNRVIEYKVLDEQVNKVASAVEVAYN